MSSQQTQIPRKTKNRQPVSPHVDDARPLPVIDFPEDLPVSALRQDIEDSIKRHQVLIVSGETGSGKTTQLPKICLNLGRRRIGHTQPRRIAATSVAKRIAQELNTEIGDWVGYQIRFSDRSGPSCAIKLMTDGILLAQTARDPLLRSFDTIIIDEAHERSLNIDFLLGFLKQILPKRPDLKLIITSATIDAKRFADHFKDANGEPAQIIEVSGRLYPVTVNYRPIRSPQAEKDMEEGKSEQTRLDRDEENELLLGVVDAVDECCRYGAGDILVFLPGEREIRESVHVLHKYGNKQLEILPLFARMSVADQDRIFKPKSNLRRVILATNVAETSLTVPGIRFVIDSGLARVKRYSWRNKVEQLQIEKISQAAANQRAGRCGRIGSGVCIRLYDEDDFLKRPKFTDPEILRSSLASVILRMKALKLNKIEDFPFIDSPTGKAIADGYHLLHELGALNENNRLTKIGHNLAKLPLDPRIARMILAARENQSLSEVLIIAAALSIQDPRERPFDAQEASTQSHAKFKDEKSEFVSYLKLWQWYGEQVKHKASQRKLVELLRKNFLSPLRLREWHDVYTQLKALVSEQGWRLSQEPATYEQLHKALLSGLLGNIGLKTDEGNTYQGARDIRFWIHPGSTLHKKAGKWIIASELVETSRLYARCVARIEPQWIEAVGGHLLKKSWSDPQFYANRGQVLINERATLYGLQVYHGRKINYGNLDPHKARELFIREALVAGQLQKPPLFLQRNLKLVHDIERLEHIARRQDILVDEELIFNFYDRYIPEHVCQAAALDAWYKKLSATEKNHLILNKNDLMRHEAAGITSEIFPKTIQLDNMDLALSYHFEPGSPKDGVTLTVPVFAINKIDEVRCQWLVPGMLKDKVHLLLKSLPQKLRRHCVPLPDYSQAFCKRMQTAGQHKKPLLQALINDIWEHCQVRVLTQDFKLETLPAHMFVIFKVVDEHGRMLSAGRNLAQLKTEYAGHSQDSFDELVGKDRQAGRVLAYDNIVNWSFGVLPELLEIKQGNQSVVGFPALVDQCTHCALKVFDDPATAKRKHRQGLLMLFKLAFKEQIKYLSKNLRELTTLGMLYMPLGSQEELKEQLIESALAQACLQEPWPQTQQEFELRVQQAKGRFGLLLQEVIRLTQQILQEWVMAQRKLQVVKMFSQSYDDMLENLNFLMPSNFLLAHPANCLPQLPRYLKATQIRADKLRNNVARDQRLLGEIKPLLMKFKRKKQQQKGVPDERLDDFAWLLQELRVALFAQELRTPMPVSVKRLDKVWLSLNF